jgi:hypothetical protein
MLPVRWERRTREGGAARREQERTGEKRNGPLAAELPEKNVQIRLGTAWNASARASVEDHGQCRYAWRENETADILTNRPVDRWKGEDQRDRGRCTVGMSNSSLAHSVRLEPLSRDLPAPWPPHRANRVRSRIWDCRL